MASKGRTQTALFIGALVVCWFAALVADYTPLGQQLNRSRYDAALTQAPLPQRAPQSIVVAIDDETFRAKGGVAKQREILADTLEALALGQPKSVAIDEILADPPADDRLTHALKATPNLVLSCQLLKNGTWEYPLPEFAAGAAAIGHVQRPVAQLSDGISRDLNLEEVAEGNRRWALALEAFRLASGKAPIVESPQDLTVGATIIPVPRSDEGRMMRIRYVPEGILPRVSVLDLIKNPNVVKDKTVFVGITDQSATRDRLESPFGPVAGVAVHQQAFETLASGEFLSPAGYGTVILVTAFFVSIPPMLFARLALPIAYPLVTVWLAAAHWFPLLYFRTGRVFPYVAVVGSAWLAAAASATYQHFFVRRQLTQSESEKSRYQQAIHWAAHEMRTPLTAIQGSSELMSRYNLPEEKRHQFSEMIHSESKRLAKIINTFLDVERLNEGQMEMKREPFVIADVIDSCLARVRPIGERKKISISLDACDEATILGDHELMEYAVYNLLTNAVKYSPAETHVTVAARVHGAQLRIAVTDQGMGMDAKEVKQVFQKFYRTKGAEKSGEAGTGIGLSIVEQIVTHHGGRMELTSEPGKGSCFTIVVNAEPAGSGRR